jgi:hypothetical protein
MGRKDLKTSTCWVNVSTRNTSATGVLALPYPFRELPLMRYLTRSPLARLLKSVVSSAVKLP